MPTKRRKKPRPKTYRPDSDAERISVYDRCRHELRRMHLAGEYHGDPERWHPAADLLRLAARIEQDESPNNSLLFLIEKELLSYIEAPRAVQMRQAEGVGNVAFTIVINRGDGGRDEIVATRERPALPFQNGDSSE